MPTDSMPSLSRADLTQRVLDAERALMHAMQQDSLPEWLDLDLTMGQVKVLVLLHHRGPQPIGQVGSALDLGKPASSLLVDGLVRRGLVERSEDPTDRRRTFAALTPRASQLMADLQSGRHERFEAWLNQLPESDLTALASGLESLVRVAAPSDNACSSLLATTKRIA